MSIIIVKIKLQKTDGLCLFVIQSDISINQSINYGQISIIQTGIVINLLRFYWFNLIFYYYYTYLLYWRHDLFQIQLLVIVVVFLFLEQHPNTSIWWPKKKLGDHKHTSRSPYLFGTKKMVLHRHTDTCWIVELEEKKN